MKRLKYLICYFFDHRYNESVFEYGAWECTFCKRYGHYGDPVIGNEFYWCWFMIIFKIKQGIRRMIEKIKSKFNKENDSVPF